MTVETESDWRRLHPLTVFKELGGLAWAIIAALVLDFEQIPFPVDFVDPEIAIAVGVSGYAVVRYFFTAYRITERTLELRRGVFVRSLQVMPRQRVQAVNAVTGFVGRLLGVTTVEVSAADAEDIKLGFVSEAEGERLRLNLESDVEVADEDLEPGQFLASTTPGRLAVYGLTQTSLIIAVVVLVGAIVVAFLVGNPFLPAPMLFLGFWPLFQTINLVGFRSWIEHDRVRAEAGVVGKRRSESPLDRIQVVDVHRPPLRRLAGHETIRIVTGDAGISAESIRIAGMVAPLEPIGSWTRIADPLTGPVMLGEPDLIPSSRLTIRRAAVRGGLAVAVLAAAAVIAGQLFGIGWWSAVVVASFGSVLVALYARVRWAVLGWAVDGSHLLVRRGVVDRRLTLAPIHKVQDVTLRQTFFQHRLGIANVEVDTAGVMGGGRILAIDLPVGRARELADHLAEAAARVALPDGV